MTLNYHNLNRATMKKNSKAKKLIIKPPLTEETLRTFSKTDEVEQLKTINRSLHRINEAYLRLMEMQAEYMVSMAQRLSELTGGVEPPEPPELNIDKVDDELLCPGLN